MMLLLDLVLVLAVLVILVRVCCIAANLRRSRWCGHLWQFDAFAIGLALQAGGAVGILLGYAPGGVMLLLGLALQVLFDRRRYNLGPRP